MISANRDIEACKETANTWTVMSCGTSFALEASQKKPIVSTGNKIEANPNTLKGRTIQWACSR